MSSEDKIVERRQHERFELKERAYVSYNSGQTKIGQTKLGQIADISRGGLAFLIIEECKHEAMKVVIFSQGSDFWLDRIPVSVRGQRTVDSRPFFSLTTLRRYSVQFGDLSTHQAREIDHFIKDFTVQ